jgi:hypothetical protein
LVTFISINDLLLDVVDDVKDLLKVSWALLFNLWLQNLICLSKGWILKEFFNALIVHFEAASSDDAVLYLIFEFLNFVTFHSCCLILIDKFRTQTTVKIKFFVQNLQ